jgi:hypothetical protein
MALQSAKQEKGRIILSELHNEHDAIELALMYIDRYTEKELSLLFESVKQTSERIDAIPNLEKLYFLDAGMRPMVPLLHDFRSYHQKKWPQNEFLPIGRELSHMTPGDIHTVLPEVSDVEGNICIIDEFSFSGITLDVTADVIAKHFQIEKSRVFTHAMIDKNTGNGYFTRPRSCHPDGDGLQWDNPDIAFRFSVLRTEEKHNDTSVAQSTAMNMHTLVHTTERLVTYAQSVVQNPSSYAAVYLQERKKQATLDRLFYRTYIQELRDSISSFYKPSR